MHLPSAPGVAFRRLPVELVFCILELLGLQTQLEMRGVCHLFQAVVDRLGKSEHLMISLGEPPSWMNDGGVATDGWKPAEQLADPAAGQSTSAQAVHCAWMRRKRIDLIRLEQLDRLTALRFERLAQVVRLRSLWIYEPVRLNPRREYFLDLARLRPLATLQELRLDVPVDLSVDVQLHSVRRLQLAPGYGSYRPLDLDRTFPSLQRLACDVIRMRTVPGVHSNGVSTVTELRLVESVLVFSAEAAGNVRRWMPRLQRLRLEAKSSARLPLLADFNGLTHLEYCSSYLVSPGKDTVPDLAEQVARLQQSMVRKKAQVTLWGFLLGEGGDQAELLHQHLRDLLEESKGRGLDCPSAFDLIPLGESQTAGQPGESSEAA